MYELCVCHASKPLFSLCTRLFRDTTIQQLLLSCRFRHHNIMSEKEKEKEKEKDKEKDKEKEKDKRSSHELTEGDEAASTKRYKVDMMRLFQAHRVGVMELSSERFKEDLGKICKFRVESLSMARQRWMDSSQR